MAADGQSISLCKNYNLILLGLIIVWYTKIKKEA